MKRTNVYPTAHPYRFDFVPAELPKPSPASAFINQVVHFFGVAFMFSLKLICLAVVLYGVGKGYDWMYQNHPIALTFLSKFLDVVSKLH